MNKIFFYLLISSGLLFLGYGITDPFDQFPQTVFEQYLKSAFAETSYRGYDYLLEMNQDGSYTRTLGLSPYILNPLTNSYEPFVFNSTTNTVNTEHGSIRLNQDCTYSYFPKGFVFENSTALFVDRIIAKYADISDLNSWTYPNGLNNQSCTNSWNGEQFNTSKLNSNIGLLEYKYVLSDGKWKTQLEATNLSVQTTKAFGFDQIIDLNRDTIKFGGQVRNLDNFDGVTFDRQFIENNKAKFLDLMNGFYFDFDLGYNYLYSIKVVDTGADKSRLIFDFRTDVSLAPNETLVIDPTFGAISGSIYSVETSASTGATCAAASTAGTSGLLTVGDSATSETCTRVAFEFDISNVPTVAQITDVDIGFTVASATNARNSTYNQIVSQPSLASATTRWDDIGDGTSYVSNDSTSATNGAKTLDLGTSADTDMQSALDADRDWFAVGIKTHNESRDASDHEVTLSVPTLTLTYNLPPDPPKQFAATVYPSTGVRFTWSAGETNGDTHQSYEVERYSASWSELTSTTSTNFIDSEPLVASTAKYRIWDTGSLGRTCSQFAMNATITDNLVSHFPFCYTTNDNGIQDNDGSVTGNELYDEQGGTVGFSGDGTSYVIVPNEVSMDFETNTPFSISGRIYPTSASDMAIFYKSNSRTADNSSWGIQYSSSGAIVFGIRTSTSQNNNINTSTSSVPINTWTHFVVTFDGSGNRSGMKIYLDGALDTTGNAQAMTGSILNNRSPVIGAESDGGIPFSGLVHDVMVFDIALDAHQVDQLYDETVDTYTLAMKPHAVTDLTASGNSFSGIDLSWSVPFVFGTCTGFQINYTTPFGNPLTIIETNNDCITTEFEVEGLVVGSENSFRVSAINVYGKNGSGNIANATVLSEFTIGDIDIDSDPNPNIFPIRFIETSFNSTTKDLNVILPDDVTEPSCSFSYKFAQTSDIYQNFTVTPYETGYDNATFRFVGFDNEIIDVYCWDNDENATNGSYMLRQTTIPFITNIQDFQAGNFGTDGMFGAIDFITLLVIIVSMIGFNKENPAVGLIIAVMILGSASFFEIIELESTLVGALALVVMLAIVITRKP
jgi:hypothetical protein